jgi:hypothetical protein
MPAARNPFGAVTPPEIICQSAMLIPLSTVRATVFRNSERLLYQAIGGRNQSLQLNNKVIFVPLQ